MMSIHRDHRDFRDRDRGDRDYGRPPTGPRRDFSFNDRDRDRSDARGRERQDLPSYRRRDSGSSPGLSNSPGFGSLNSSPSSEVATEKGPPKVCPTTTKSTSQTTATPEVTLLAKTFAELGSMNLKHENATKRADKLRRQQQKLGLACDFASERPFLSTELKEAQSQKTQCELALMALNVKAEKEICALWERRQKKEGSAPVFENRVQALEASIDKRIEEALKQRAQSLEAEFKSKEEKLISRVEDLAQTNKRMEERMESLSAEVTTARLESSESRKVTAQLKEDVDIPRLKELSVKSEQHDQQASDLAAMHLKIDAQQQQAVDTEALVKTIEGQAHEIQHLKTLLESNHQQISATVDVQARQKQELASMAESLEQRHGALQNLKATVDTQSREIQDLRWLVESQKQKISSMGGGLPDAPSGETHLAQLKSIQDTVQSQGKDIEAFKSLHETVQSLQDAVVSQEQRLAGIVQKTADLDLQNGGADAQSNRSTDIGSIQVKLASQERQIADVKSLIDDMEGRFQAATKSAINANTKPTPVEAGSRDHQDSLFTIQNTVLGLLQDQRSLQNMVSRHNSILESGSRQSPFNNSTPGANDVAAFPPQLREQVEIRITQAQTQLRERINNIIQKAGALIDEEGGKRKELEQWTMSRLETLNASLAANEQTMASLKTEFGGLPQLAASLRSELTGAQTSLTEQRQQFELKVQNDAVYFDDLGLRLHSVQSWQQNFSTSELAKNMVTHIANAIPNGTQVQMRMLYDRVNYLENFLPNDDSRDISRKRKAPHSSQAATNGHH